MKKFLSIALLVVLVASVFVVATTAGDDATYWEIDSDCLVTATTLTDGTVPTYKAVSDGDINGLLVGLPADATYGKTYFKPKTGYDIQYKDKNGFKIDDDKAHIGTTDKIVVTKDGAVVAQYGLVTYGDADGDGYFDVIDSAMAALCFKNFISADEAPAVYEAMKPRAGADNEEIVVDDYQYIVNDSMKSDSDRVENKKGRKTPINTNLAFESVIYENTGATRAAAVTAEDDNFKKLITIKYNGSATAPSASGIYAITAEISDSEMYLVTPGVRELGFIVIAPKAATGYKVTADNAGKKIVIGTTDNDTANTTIAAEFEKWLNSAYTLNVGGTTNPATVASALPNRQFEVYSNQAKTLTKTPESSVLGSYLPDDETLWINNFAANTKTVTLTNGPVIFSFDLSFQQDKATIEAAKRAYFVNCADAARGQRTDYTSSKNKDGTLTVTDDVKKVNLFVKMKNDYPTIRVAVKDASVYCADALGGTGLKGVLVDRAESVAFQSSATNDFTGKEVISLFQENGVRYSTLAFTTDLEGLNNAKIVLPVVNKVLAGLGTSIPNNAIELKYTKLSRLNIIGKKGYCNYRCSGVNSSIRYNIAFYLEFLNFDKTGEDASRTITVNTPTNGTVTVDPANQFLHERVYEHTIMNAGEPVIVKATPASGYKLKAITVTKADGTQVSVAADGYFLMPASDVTINAEFEPK